MLLLNKSFRQTNFLKRKTVYDPQQAIDRDKSSKKRPVTALVDNKWKNPPGSENENTINRSFTGKNVIF